MQEFKIDGHESSLLPEGEWSLCFSDEFDAPELDRTKWSFRRHLFHKPHPCWIEDEGLEFADSNIIFKKVKGEDGRFHSCQLQTGENWYDRPGEKEIWSVAKFSQPKFEHKFGYYEVRCKLQRGDNWWSAFWLQSPIIGTHPDAKKAGVEVDVMEAFFGNTYIPHFCHYDGYGLDYKFECTMDEHRSAKYRDVIPVDDGYHRFGCLWEEDGYTFFVDGKQSGRKITEVVSHTETFILLGTEIVGFRDRIPGMYLDADKINEIDDDKFIVDYVRVFDRKA